MKSSVLYFFLLVLKFFFNLIPDGIYKYNKFFKTFLKKGLKFVSYKKGNFVSFNSRFILLLAKVNFILKKWSYKGDTFMILSSSSFEMVCKFLKYNLGFVSLKSLSKTSTITFINKSRVWSLVFLIQVYMNCLNSFLIESKATDIKTVTRADFGVKI